MQESYIERILKARVYDVAIESPLDPLQVVPRAPVAEVLLKREDLQPVFSFKLRGAYNKIANLSDTVARRGVICALGRQPCPRAWRWPPRAAAFPQSSSCP